ncbi:MAG: ATP-binding protein, partial [Pseudomonadota bacterium]
LLSDLGRESFDLWFYLTTMGLSLASLIFVDTWTADRPRIGVRGIVVLCAGGLIILGVYLLGGQGTRQVAWYVNYGFNACLLIGVTVMLLTFGLRGTPLERAVAVLFLVATWGGMVDLIGSVSQPLAAQIFGPQGLTAPHAHLMPVPAILGFALLLHRRNMAVTTALADRGALLEAQLAEREAEIQAVYRTREAEQRETAILRERQRIMADVHDGFGGRLLALLLQVDNGEVDPTKLSAGLRESLQDLRLIIDSLDTADSDLSVALGALRGRLEPQVRAAGFELVWKVERFSGLRLSPRKTLSLYRVIQEAVTNALRHSGGSCVTLEMTRADSETLDLRIADNGRGFAPPSAATVDPIKETRPLPGKGLSNIRRRLRAFDASLEVSTAPTGSCLMAVIPIAAALAPAP